MKPLPLRHQIIAGMVVAVLILTGGILVVRQELLTELREESLRQQEGRERLDRKISGLESQLAALAATPRPDPAVIDATRAALEAAQVTVAQLTERVTTLEKRPLAESPKPLPTPLSSESAAEPAVKPTALAMLGTKVKSGQPYQAELEVWEKEHPAITDKTSLLRQNAAIGLPTDEALRNQLTALIGRLNAPESSLPETSLIARINTHLAGLVAIKKQGATHPEFTPLLEMSKSAPLDRLTASISQLPGASQAMLTPWLDTVRARNAAIAELEGLAALDAVP